MKTRVGATVKVNAYAVIDRAVEEGVHCGYMRSHKHTDTPSAAAIEDEIGRAVMNALCEVLAFGDEE